MGRAALIVTLTLFAPSVLATDPSILYLEATGDLLVGPGGPVAGSRPLANVTFVDLGFTTDACHTDLRIPISWTPREYAAGAANRSVAVDTVMHARLLDAYGTIVPSADRSFFGGSGTIYVSVRANSTFTLRLYLDVGANVDHHVKVFGWVPAVAPPGCGMG